MTIRQFANQWRQPYEANIFQQNFLLLINTLILLSIIKLFSWFTKNINNNDLLKNVDKILHVNTLTIPLTAIWFVLVRPMSVVKESQWNFFTKQMEKFVYPRLDQLLPPLYVNPNIISLNATNVKSVTLLSRSTVQVEESPQSNLLNGQIIDEAVFR